MLIGNARLPIVMRPIARKVCASMVVIDLAMLNQVPQNTPATKMRRMMVINCAILSFIFVCFSDFYAVVSGYALPCPVVKAKTVALCS